MLIALGNTEALEKLVGGVQHIEAALAGGVTLKPEVVEQMAAAVARYITVSEETRAVARQELSQTTNDLLRRQVVRIEARVVELVRERKLDRAADEVQEGLSLLSAILNEAPSDAGLTAQLGYLYKAMAQVYEAAGQRNDEEDYLTRASEAFARVTQIIPSDKKTVDDVASAINGLGNVYYGRGDYAKAIENYRVATTLVPRYAYAWHDMFAAYVALAQTGKIDLAAMREALQKTKEYGAGIPGLDAGYIAQLEGMLAAWDVPPAAAGAAAAQSGEPGSQ